MRHSITRLVALGVLVASFALPAGAQAAPGDPLFTYVPTAATVPKVQPAGYFIGPCGLGVDSTGRLYISDYYHRTVDVLSTSPPAYQGQLANVDPLDGPCGLAFDSADHLYVNAFDRAVLSYKAFPSGSPTTIAGAGKDEFHPTGVAVDPTTNDVYVNERTRIVAFDSSGAPVMNGAEPLQVGAGTLEEGYGLAIDALGRLYVADAAADTVKVYDPATSLTTPVKTFSGPAGGFTSLHHAALAINRSSGLLYVVDNLQPQYTESPRARVEVFNSNLAPASAYLGVLKYQIADALPAGIAVDNSTGTGQGNVYVTSGNTNQAGLYAYGPGSQVATSLPPTVGLGASAVGPGTGVVRSDLGELECSNACQAQIRAGATVTLSATPQPGSAFAGWSGACTGTGECEVAMDEAKEVSAEFRPLQEDPDTEAPGHGAPVASTTLNAPSGAPSPAAAPRHRAKRHRAKRAHRHHRKSR